MVKIGNSLWKSARKVENDLEIKKWFLLKNTV